MDIDIFESEIEYYIKEYCQKYEILDLSKESQNRFTGLLQYIQRKYISAMNLKCLNSNNYNSLLLYKLMIAYMELANNYNKEISANGFCKFAGINIATFNSWNNIDINNINTSKYDIDYIITHYDIDNITVCNNPYSMFSTNNSTSIKSNNIDTNNSNSNDNNTIEHISSIYNNSQLIELLSYTKLLIYKTIWLENENSNNELLGSTRNQVGIIARLNHFHNWQTTASANGTKDTNKAISIDELPILAPIDQPKLETEKSAALEES